MKIITNYYRILQNKNYDYNFFKISCDLDEIPLYFELPKEKYCHIFYLLYCFNNHKIYFDKLYANDYIKICRYLIKRNKLTEQHIPKIIIGKKKLKFIAKNFGKYRKNTTSILNFILPKYIISWANNKLLTSICKNIKSNFKYIKKHLTAIEYASLNFILDENIPIPNNNIYGFDICKLLVKLGKFQKIEQLFYKNGRKYIMRSYNLEQAIKYDNLEAIKFFIKNKCPLDYKIYNDLMAKDKHDIIKYIFDNNRNSILRNKWKESQINKTTKVMVENNFMYLLYSNVYEKLRGLDYAKQTICVNIIKYNKTNYINFIKDNLTWKDGEFNKEFTSMLDKIKYPSKSKEIIKYLYENNIISYWKKII